MMKVCETWWRGGGEGYDKLEGVYLDLSYTQQTTNSDNSNSFITVLVSKLVLNLIRRPKINL